MKEFKDVLVKNRIWHVQFTEIESKITILIDNVDSSKINLLKIKLEK